MKTRQRIAVPILADREAFDYLKEKVGERMFLLAVGGQCLVQCILRDCPGHALGVRAFVLVSPQYQCPGNDVVDMAVPWQCVLLIDIVINDLYPCTILPDPIDHLSI